MATSQLDLNTGPAHHGPSHQHIHYHRDLEKPGAALTSPRESAGVNPVVMFDGADTWPIRSVGSNGDLMVAGED